MLDGQARLFVDAALAARDRPTHLSAVADIRDREARQLENLPAGPPVSEVRDFVIDGPEHRVRARVIGSVPDAPGVIVFLHGGGWVLGSIELYDAFARTLSVRSGWTVMLVGYRRAPEHRFPAAVDDAWCALRSVVENRDKFAPNGKIVVAGDSAGGNLAAAVTRRARDSGLAIDRHLLIYPVTDADLERPSYLADENQLLLRRETMEWFWGHYLPDRDARSHPDASPLRAESHAGLPPALVVLAEHDVLFDEGQAYADALTAAGVPVQLCVLRGQFHGFVPYIGMLSVSSDLVDVMVRYLGS